MSFIPSFSLDIDDLDSGQGLLVLSAVFGGPLQLHPNCQTAPLHPETIAIIITRSADHFGTTVAHQLSPV